VDLAEAFLLLSLLLDGKNSDFEKTAITCSPFGLEAFSKEFHAQEITDLKILKKRYRKLRKHLLDSLAELDEASESSQDFASHSLQDITSLRNTNFDVAFASNINLDANQSFDHLDIDNAPASEKESMYDESYYTMSRHSIETHSLGLFNLPTDAAKQKIELKRYILEAIKEEDLRKLHQLIDICDVCGIGRVEFPVLHEAETSVTALLRKSDLQNIQRVIAQSMKTSTELEKEARELTDPKKRARTLYNAALMSGDMEKISKAIARMRFHGMSEVETTVGRKYLHILACKQEIDKALQFYDVDKLDRELARARHFKFSSFAPPFLPANYLWSYFVKMENILGQWLTLRNVYHDLSGDFHDREDGLKY
jgi:hypothetical protein